VLLFNIHTSSQAGAQRVLFPKSETELPPDKFAPVLFRSASELPDGMRTLANTAGLAPVPGSRGFMFNADPVEVITLLDIGTRAAMLR
jgi:hypothetical protein